MQVIDHRATSILYRILVSNPEPDGFYLVPANICHIVPLAFLKAKQNFKFVDISEDHLCMDGKIVNELLLKYKNQVKGILFSRTYGVEEDFTHLFKKWKEIAPQLKIIDDKCLCFPQFKENPGPYVDLELYSTGYAKSVDIGYGGFAQFNNNWLYTSEIYEKYSSIDLEHIENEIKESQQKEIPFIYKDSDWLKLVKEQYAFETFSPIVLKEQFESRQIKEKINNIYIQAIDPRFVLPRKYNNWRFNITVNNQAELRQKIFDNNLFASTHYYNLTKIFPEHSITDINRNYRNVEKLAKQVINMFNYKYFNNEKAQKLAGLIETHAR